MEERQVEQGPEQSTAPSGSIESSWSEENQQAFRNMQAIFSGDAKEATAAPEKSSLPGLSIEESAAPGKQVYELGPNLPAQHFNNPDYSVRTGEGGRLESVVDSKGREVAKFSDYQNGKPTNIQLADGGRIGSSDGGASYNWVDQAGKPNGLGPLENLTVDDKGNVTFDMLMPEGRVTFSPDGAKVFAEDSRADLAERSKEAIVEKSADGLQVLDKDGKPIRSVEYGKDGKPELIRNSDGSSWHSFNGGKSWTFTREDGSSYPMQDAGEFKVDGYGNVIYNAYGKVNVDTIDGKRIELP